MNAKIAKKTSIGHVPRLVSSHAENLSGCKELVQALSLVVSTKDGPREVVVARFYMGRSNKASQVICSLWVWGKGISVSGKGSAGGYGYCKKSAAFDKACTSAGIELSSSVHGCGMGSAFEAMTAIAKAIGYNGKSTIISHS